MMITVQCVNRKEIFIRATLVPAPTTPTACIHLSKLPPGAYGCAPSARRKYVPLCFEHTRYKNPRSTRMSLGHLFDVFSFHLDNEIICMDTN